MYWGTMQCMTHMSSWRERDHEMNMALMLDMRVSQLFAEAAGIAESASEMQ